MTLIIDAEGIYYRVPICVINDPVNYDADYVNEKLKKKTAPKQEATINVNYCKELTLHLESTSALYCGWYKVKYFKSCVNSRPQAQVHIKCVEDRFNSVTSAYVLYGKRTKGWVICI